MPERDKIIQEQKREIRNFKIINVLAAVSVLVGAIVIIFTRHDIQKANNEIQNERVSSVLRTCHDQNKRHDAAIRALDKLLRKSGVTAKRRARTHLQIDPFVDAIVPKQNCQKRLELIVPSKVKDKKAPVPTTSTPSSTQL